MHDTGPGDQGVIDMRSFGRRRAGTARPDRRGAPPVLWRAVTTTTARPAARMVRASGEFEFFSWWTGGGDSEGKQALLDLFAKQNPGIEVVDSAIAGGAGTNAQAELANRLIADDPPDSYQRHAGKELAADIEAGEVEDLTSLYDDEGWRDVFPERLLELHHGGRQALLRAGQHPPVERALVQPSRPRGGRDRRAAGDLGRVPHQAETLEGGGQGPADGRPDLDPAAPARERAPGRARRRLVHRAVGRHDRLGVS